MSTRKHFIGGGTSIDSGLSSTESSQATNDSSDSEYEIDMSFVEIANKQGLSAKILTLGATLAKLSFPDKHGNPRDLVLGYDNVEEFSQDTAYMGKTVGRVANRILNGSFKLENQVHKVPCAEHLLHGGPNSICFKVWEIVRHGPATVSLNVKAHENEDGFPGTANIDVTYTINDRNQLIIEHHATVSQLGVLGLTNHTYWNLDGGKTINDHFLEIDANEYQEGENGVPTGKIGKVHGTIFDFQSAKQLKSVVDKEAGIIKLDHDFYLPTKREMPTNHLRLYSKNSGIEMSVTTSYPCVHIYTAQHLKTTGKNKEDYGPNKGIAVEPQFHSGALNFDHFPDLTIKPGTDYSQEIVYTFSHLN